MVPDTPNPGCLAPWWHRKYSSISSVTWQWCCHSRHTLESGLSLWEKIWIQMSHLFVAITISVWHNTATDSIISARGSWVELLLLHSEDGSRCPCSGEGSGLWMEVATRCLVSGSFWKGIRLWVYSAVSFPLWLHGHVFWGFSHSSALLMLALICPWGQCIYPCISGSLLGATF